MANLKTKTDQELLTQTLALVKNERDLLVSILHHLREIERRRLFSSLGYKSLFDYCVKCLGYSQDAAYRRIEAMRALKELPQVEEKIASGSVNLTNLSLAQKLFKTEKKMGAELSSTEKLEILASLENKSTREAEKIVLAHSSATKALVTEKVRPVTDALSEIKFLASEELLEKIEKLKGLLAHSHPNISIAELLNVLSDLGLKKWGYESLAEEKTKLERTTIEAALEKTTPEKGKPEKTKTAKALHHFEITTPTEEPTTVGKTSSKISNNLGAPVSPRKNIPVKIKRLLWAKSGGKCENCQSQYALEFDHIRPKSLGGSDEIENLRVLCRYCNQRAAIHSLGLNKMSRFLNS